MATSCTLLRCSSMWTALPVRANSVDPQFFASWIDELLVQTSHGGEWNWFFPTTLNQVQARYQSARAVYQQISLEAQGAAPTLTSIAVTPLTKYRLRIDSTVHGDGHVLEW